MNEHRKELREFFNTTLQLIVPVLVVVFFIAIIIVGSANPHSYASSLMQKEKLLHDTSSPRLIILGGSGAASSIDSTTLEKTLDLNPVNMGLFAGVGMRFIINEAKNEIRKGDVILLAPEYEMLQQPSYGDGSYLLQTLYANPSKIISVVTPHGLIVMLRAFPSILQWQGGYIVHTIQNYFLPKELVLSERLYTLEHVTKYGDLDTTSAGDAHLSTAQIVKEGNGFVRSHIDPKNLSLIINLFTETKQKGARAFIVLPAVPESVKENNMPAISAQYETLVSALGTENVIGTPGYFVLPDNQFLDSLGHLTATGKAERTKLILFPLAKQL